MNLNGVLPVFYAEDLKPVLDFYTDVLGFTADLVQPDEENPEVLLLDHGKVSILYSKAGRMPPSTGQVNFDVDDVKDVMKILPASVESEWGPEAFPYGRTEFAIRDPNGIVLVFSMPTRTD